MTDDERREPKTRVAGTMARTLVFVACATYLFASLFLALITLTVSVARSYEPIVVSSESMAPTIRRGDVMLVQPVAPESIGLGAVVTFPRPGVDGYLSHRVVASDDRGLITRGDANADSDSTRLDPADAVGVGRLLVPLAGFPVLWITTGAWLPLAGWVLTILAAFTVVRHMTVTSATEHGEASPLRKGRRTAAAGVAGVALTFVVAGSSTFGAFNAADLNAGNTFTADFWLGIVSITSGHEHTCVAKVDGSAWCWGENSAGQLGDGTATDRGVPTQVVGPGGVGTLGGVVAVAGGDEHTCAARDDGSAWCWGRDDRGQLGNAGGNSATPTQVTGVGGGGTLAGVTSVSTGADHSCAATDTGALYCWGYNSGGQLGDDSTSNRTSPVRVVGVGGSGTLDDVATVGTGYDLTCAATDTGALYCWGYNGTGQVGDGTTTNRDTPVQVVGPGGVGTLTGIVGVDSGYDHTCAVTGGGAAWCWGANARGQLGDDTTSTSHTPVQVVGVGGVGNLGSVAAIGAGYDTSCAVDDSGSAFCWGRNGRGQLGDGTTTNRDTPVSVVGSGGVGTLAGSIDVAVGGFIASDRSHTCAALTDEEAWCWGSNNSGQLGDNTTTERHTPVEAQFP